MPTVGIPVGRLRKLMRADVDDARLEQLLDQLGCDVDGIAEVSHYLSPDGTKLELLPGESMPLTDPYTGRTAERAEDLWTLDYTETVIRLELLPVRPDLFDAGGLARALRGYLGSDVGLPHYAVTDTGPLNTGLTEPWRVEVDPRLSDARYGRPYIQCAVIRDLKFEPELLRAVMRLQEHLHWALARDRKFASIGMYDLSTLENPIRYTLVDRERFRFTPLFWGHREPVSPATMLAEHPKGIGYASLVEGLSEVPALLAANDVVLSLPPIINAEESKVTPDTRDVLIDVTGSNLPVVTRALAILATSLLELDVHGTARLERVVIDYGERSEETPALETQQVLVHPERAAKLIGVPLTREDCRELLLKMRHGVGGSEGGAGTPARDEKADKSVRPTDNPLLVTVAPYRNDILHEVDLIEDIAIAYGYHHIEPKLVPSFTAGRLLPLTALSRRAATALQGLGFLETQSLTLTSERDHYEKLRLPVREPRVTMSNPISTDLTMLREHLYGGLLALLSDNTDQPLPQRVFEVGDVAKYAGAGGAGTPAREQTADRSVRSTDATPPFDPPPTELRIVAGASCAPRAGYAEGRSVLDALLHELDLRLSYRAADNPTALLGRAAEATDDSGNVVAELFEVHPEVLSNFGLQAPVVLFSVTLGEVEYQ